jgi:hypothetical protein
LSWLANSQGGALLRFDDLRHGGIIAAAERRIGREKRDELRRVEVGRSAAIMSPCAFS